MARFELRSEGDLWRVYPEVRDGSNHSMASGLATKSKPKSKRFAVVNRLAIEELEAWYFGDWEAVQRAYPKVNANVPSQAKYRAPESVVEDAALEWFGELGYQQMRPLMGVGRRVRD